MNCCRSPRESLPYFLPLPAIRGEFSREPNFLEVQLTVGLTEGAVEYSVTDSGVGIAPENLPHLFERFYRVDKSRSRTLGGSGIGLTIAQALVESMGGTIKATSIGLGQGSTFNFTLPLHQH
ncbi:MAG: hypothetical protein HXX20_18690 [Chloroflexi bacterium]|nr:hypothetical protein [Chloroflexota bacterium]